MKNKITKKQADAVRAAQKTLDAIDYDTFWNNVLTRIAPKVEANQMIRVKSHGKASSRVLM